MSTQAIDIESNSGVQVISRATSILRVLGEDTSGLSLVQRIVGALVKERMMVATSAEGGLKLGPEIQSLAAACGHDTAARLRPLLDELSATTLETVDLAVLRDGHMVFLDQVEGSHRLRAVSSVGGTFPLTTTANGKAALAELGEREALRLWRAEKRRDGSPEPDEGFKVTMEQVRRFGYALDLDEHTKGISAVGCAFTDQSGKVMAISIPVPSPRFRTARKLLAESLLGTRERLASILQLSDG